MGRHLTTSCGHMIPNDLIQDTSISPECRWLLFYFLSHKHPELVTPKQVIDHLKPFMGRDKVYKIFNEAIEAGYIKKEEVKKGSLYHGIKYYISEKILKREVE